MGVRVREKIKGSGIWWVFFDHKGIRGSKKCGSKKMAGEVAKQLEAGFVRGDLQLDTNKKPDIPTFESYASAWLTVTVPATCKESTAEDYKRILKNHVLPVFGKKHVTEINKLMVKQFLMGKVNAGLASSTVIHIKNVVSGVLNLALDDDVIPFNPAYNVGKIFKTRASGLESQPYTADEIRRLMEVLKDDFPRHHPFFLTLARTGMRLGEGLGLQWRDIDFEKRFIHIRRGLSKGKISTPKSGRDRIVDMSESLADTLKHLHVSRKLEKLKNGWGQIPEWVFVNQAGGAYHESYLRRVFYKAIEKAGLRRIRIHDLRHTYATLRISKGDHASDVSKQLGHHSEKFTTDIYYHWKPGRHKKEIDELDTLCEEVQIRTLSAPK